jgi:protocatechuate 3,4-dioxygenase beta subunit
MTPERSRSQIFHQASTRSPRTKAGFIESIYGQREPGSGRAGTLIKLTAGQQLKDVSLPLARGAVLTGRVLDEVGDPAFGISVRAYKWTMKSGERRLVQVATGATDDRGVYRIPALLPGDYVVGVAASTTGSDLLTMRINGATEFVRAVTVDGMIEAPMFVRARDDAGGSKSAPKTGFAAAYYPGVGQVSAAQPITIGPGEERPNVDFSLQVVPLAQVSGVLSSPTGPVSAAMVQLVDTTQPPGFGMGRTARTGPDGRFVFEGVTPGQYSLMTQATPKGGAQLEAGMREAVEFLAKASDNAKAAQVGTTINAAVMMWASADVPVDGRDQTDIQLVLQPGTTVSGRVVTDGGADVSFLRMSVGLATVGLQAGDRESTGPAAAVDANGRFTIKGMSPGRYRLTVMGGMPSGHSLASAVFAGQDILDVPLVLTGAPGPSDGVVTLTTRATELAGTIQDAMGQPATGVTVIVYASDERFWTPGSRRIQAIRPASDGQYAARNLPPGDYRLVVVTDVEPGRWFDPAFLRTLGGFSTISISPGAKMVQDFRIK